MNASARYLALAAAGLGGAARSWADPEVITFFDPPGDAGVRRTDSGANGPTNPAGGLPDLLRVSLQGWESFAPASNPWSGVSVPGEDANLFRLDLVFRGVVNPPGPIGAGGTPDPFRFGPSPVYGFVELDTDDKLNTGGEVEAVARGRYLANVARFGRRPEDSIGERIARWAKDYDATYLSPPWYERNGAEFLLAFCGCLDTELLFQTHANGGTPGIFDAGETWIIRDRFFQRSGGYKCASGAFGGTGFGLYDPTVMLRWSHDPAANETTVTLVYALTMEGAAALAAQPIQQPNYSVLDHTSVYEAIKDVVEHAAGTSGFCGAIAGGWAGQDPGEDLDPTDWEVTALVGTAYSEPQDSFYAWTDTGFKETAADMDGDGEVNSADRLVVQQTIQSLDGGVDDADGLINGSVRLVDFGPNFHLSDITGDGIIGALDISAICPADYNGDGQLTVSDFGAFQVGWVSHDPRADFNRDGAFTVGDLGAFQSAFVAGCP